MRETHFDSRALHASGQKMTGDQVQAISDFFRTCRISRFALLVAAPPMNPVENALELLRPILLDEFVALVDSLPKVPDDIVLQFEHSDRLLPKLMATLPNIEIEMLDGRPVPVTYLVTPKSERVPVLEMADHVLHRAQRARRDVANATPAAWFTDVFPQTPSPHARYVELRLGSFSSNGCTVDFLDNGRVRITFGSRNHV
jgi:hypothetical protein